MRTRAELAEIGLSGVSISRAETGLGATTRAEEGLGPPRNAEEGLGPPPPSVGDAGPTGAHAHLDSPILPAEGPLAALARQGLSPMGLDVAALSEIGLAYIGPNDPLALAGLGPPKLVPPREPDAGAGLAEMGQGDARALVGLNAIPGRHHAAWTREPMQHQEPDTEPRHRDDGIGPRRQPAGWRDVEPVAVQGPDVEPRKPHGPNIVPMGKKPPKMLTVTAGTASQVSKSPVIGHQAEDYKGPPNGSELVGIYGGDLGLFATLQGTTYVLFGDTWVSGKNGQPTAKGPKNPDNNNDSMGVFTVDTAGNPYVDFNSFTDDGGTQRYSAIRLKLGDTSSFPLGNLSTPWAAFATDNFLYATFWDPANGTRIGRYVDNSGGYSNFVAVGHPFGAPSFIENFTPDPETSGGGYALPSPPLGKFDFFANSAAAVGDPLDGSILPIGVNRPVYIWGRPWVSAAFPRATNLYLAVVDADVLDGSMPGGPPARVHFLVGFDDDGNPLWDSASKKGATGSKESFSWAALPVPLPQDGDEAVVVNQMSFAYDPNLGIWIMLYGGRVAGSEDPEGGIMFRWALNPWGPWSSRQRVFDRLAPGGCEIVFDGKSWIPGPDGKLVAADKQTTCIRPDEFVLDQDVTAPGPVSKDHYLLLAGAEYGASIWRILPNNPLGLPFITSTIYFAMSTFNPYHVLLMEMVIGPGALK